MDTGITIWVVGIAALYSTGHWVGATVVLASGFVAAWRSA